MTRTRLRIGFAALSVICVLTLSAAPAPAETANARHPICTPSALPPGTNGCLPTPAQCATGLYNGVWSGGYDGRFASCLGGGGHVASYVGGYVGDDQYAICGTIIKADEVVTGMGWLDPNFCPPTSARGTSDGPVVGRAFQRAVSGRAGVVASGSALASEAGLEVLRGGGNAIDAAAATVFALGVTRPHSAGIGGNGFLVYRGADGQTATLDFEAAIPAAVTADTFSGEGMHNEGTGHKVVGVPGTVAGMTAALERFGTIGLAQAIAPAERLAYDGVPVSEQVSTAYKGSQDHDVRLARFPASAAVYLRNGVQYPPDNPQARSILVQRAMARSLALVARYGRDAFYRSGDYPAFTFQGHHYAAGRSVADLIADDMAASQSSLYEGDAGIMQLSDLAGYEAKWRKPLKGSYRGSEIITMGAPDAGGTFTLEALNILEGFDIPALGYDSADRFHLVAEAQKIAWADRNAYNGDPDFVDVPSFLTSKGYAAQRRSEIDLAAAKCFGPGRPGSPSAPCDGEASAGAEGHTAHISVIDRAGNAVAVTFSLSQAFGSAVVAPGTGFLLNSNVDEFAPAGSPGAVVGGRRMPRSPVTPMIVVKGGQPIALGGAGGATIQQTVLQTVSGILDFDFALDRALDAPRMFGLTCCAIDIEDGRLADDVVTDLRGRGHTVTRGGEYLLTTQLHAVGADAVSGLRYGASDPRDDIGAEAE